MTDNQRAAFNRLPPREKLEITDQATDAYYAALGELHPCGAPRARVRLCVCDTCGGAMEDGILAIWRDRSAAAKAKAETTELEDATTEADRPMENAPAPSPQADPRAHGLARLRQRREPKP